MKTVLNMETTSSEERTPKTLPTHAALIREAQNLDGAPAKGWYFAIMVRAAYSRLEGVA